MDIKKLKEIDRVFRQYGIEGEDTFRLISTQYLNAHNPQKISKELKLFWEEGKVLLVNISEDKIARQTLEYVISNDFYGENLPIIYQFFLSKRFRDLSGKFFTPKNLAWLMAAMLPVKENAVIFDPTCGGGTFLLEASKRWGNKKCTLIGNDVDKLLVVLSEILLLLNKKNEHKLKFHNQNIYNSTQNLELLFGKVDYILANPPFSLSIESFEIKSKLFENGYRNSDALFLDLCLKILKPGGHLLCLVPHSIVANKEYENLRNIIEQDWEIASIIIMPEGTFHSTSNTTTRADIIYLRKKSKEKIVDKIIFGNISNLSHLTNDKEGIIANYKDLAFLLDDLNIEHTLK